MNSANAEKLHGPTLLLGRISYQTLTKLLPAGFLVVNDDRPEVADVRSGRPYDQQVAESVKKSLRSIIFQEIGSIETPGARARARVVEWANAPAGSVAAPLPPSVSAASAVIPDDR
jgi:pyruvate/2-oxoglutarate/acetoin dehydrogenase E1 component